MENLNSDSRQEPGKLLIVADDFTGAADTGVQFSKKHLRTLVISEVNHLKSALGKCDVLVMNTESRFDDRDTAYKKTFDTGRKVSSENVKYFYKKHDSTMRGNVGAEIAGLMDSLGIGITFMVPALPKYGRTTMNGKVIVNDTLLEESEFASDPKNPVDESFIPKILSRQTDKKTAVIIHDYVRAGSQTLIEKVQYHINAGTQIIVFDAKDDSDIDMITSVITGLEIRALYAGCSGLAEYLAKYLEIKREIKTNVVIAGSVSDVTRRQVEFAAHYLRCRIIDIQTERIFTPERNDEKKRILQITGECAGSGEDLIIRSAPSREAVSQTFNSTEEAGIDRFTVSETIAVFLGEIAGEIIQCTGINGILLTGGDTAYKTAKSLKASGFTIHNEIEHGIPFGYFQEEKYRNVIIVTKAGGFGQDDAIFRVLNFLRTP